MIPYTQNLDHGQFHLADHTAQYKACVAKVQELQRWQQSGHLPLLNLPAAREDLQDLRPIAQRFRENFSHVIILGTGGSSLGGKSLYALCDNGFGPTSSPKLHFLDNVDPTTFEDLLAQDRLKDTGFIIISKSGTTAETLCQFLTCLQAIGPDQAARQMLAITEPGSRPLRDLAEQYNIPTLDHDPNVGGRYAVLSLVGLLPALIAGLDAEAIRAGATAVLTHTLEHPAEAAPVLGTLWQTAGDHSQSVMLPYIDALQPFALWYRQLWAESLGKHGKGTTPLAAIGTVDQHSQLQLWLDGPKDKIFTLLLKDATGHGPAITTDHPQLTYMNSRSMGDLLMAEQQATLESLATVAPCRTFRLPTVDAATLGALFMHFMLETILAAHLLEVNPFDQPAVEAGKIKTRQLMGS